MWTLLVAAVLIMRMLLASFFLWASLTFRYTPPPKKKKKQALTEVPKNLAQCLADWHLREALNPASRKPLNPKP